MTGKSRRGASGTQELPHTPRARARAHKRPKSFSRNINGHYDTHYTRGLRNAQELLIGVESRRPMAEGGVLMLCYFLDDARVAIHRTRMGGPERSQRVIERALCLAPAREQPWLAWRYSEQLAEMARESIALLCDQMEHLPPAATRALVGWHRTMCVCAEQRAKEATDD